MHNLAVRHMWEALGRLGGVGWVGGGLWLHFAFRSSRAAVFFASLSKIDGVWLCVLISPSDSPRSTCRAPVADISASCTACCLGYHEVNASGGHGRARAWQ